MIEWLQGLPPLVVYATVFLVVGVESVGVPLPGETVLIGAALLAGQGVVSPVTVAVCAALSAAIGDTVGYLLGRRFGDRLFAWAAEKSPKHLGPDKFAAARTLDRGRFVALLRILSGPLAGSLGMPYRRFALANWTGAALWAGATTAVVVALGAAAEQLLSRISTGGLVAIAVVAVAAVVVLRVRSGRRRRQRQSEGG